MYDVTLVHVGIHLQQNFWNVAFDKTMNCRRIFSEVLDYSTWYVYLYVFVIIKQLHYITMCVIVWRFEFHYRCRKNRIQRNSNIANIIVWRCILTKCFVNVIYIIHVIVRVQHLLLITLQLYFCSYIVFLEQETLLSLLSTGWFQERIRAWFT